MATGIAADLSAGASSESCAEFAAIVDRLEQRVRELEEKPLPVPPGDALLDEGSYVCNLSTSCWHYTCAKPSWPAEYQRANCGWAFHYVRYQRSVYKPGGKGIGSIKFCKRCLPEAASQDCNNHVVSDVD